MNKEQYASVLERQLTREDDEKSKRIQKNPLYKDLDRSIVKLEKQIRKLRDEKDKISYKRNWSERSVLLNQFRADWDEMSLILDKKNRDTAKEKLLKKYKLYR